MKSTFAGRIMHRLAFICGALVMMLAMAGCSAGSTIDTTLVINEDLSGTRKMNITIADNVYQEYFTGNIEDLNALMDAACPEGMTWSYSDTDGVKQYDMEIVFSSPEDYKEKVKKILGVDEVELTLAAPDTVWASGISVSESFTDEELLAWMKNLLVDNGFVSSDNAGMIFGTGEVSVTYGDSTYDAGSRINVSEVEYVSVEAIHILTQVDELGSYDRRVVVKIPTDSMEKKGGEIRVYMDSIVPVGAKGEWSEGENGTLFSVSADNLTVEQLDAFNKSVFDSEASNAVLAEAYQESSPFTFGEHLTEHIDLTGYVADNRSSIRVVYGMKKADSFYAYNWRDVYSKGSEGTAWQEYPGYEIYRDDYCYDTYMDYSTLIQKAYKVQDLSVVTDRTLGGSWKRSLAFALENTPAKEEQEAITAVLKARLGLDEEKEADEETETAESSEAEESSEAAPEEKKEEKPDVKISAKTSNDVYTVTITQKGTGEELKLWSEMLFGADTNVFYAEDREFWKIKRQTAFEEVLSFGNLLEYTTVDFAIDYTAKLGFLSDVQYCSVDSAEMKGGKLQANFSNGRVKISYVGSRVNLVAVLFWVLLAVSAVSLLVLLIKLGLFKKKEKTVAEAAATEAVVSETAVPDAAESREQQAAPETVKVQEEAQPAASRFCEKCGTPREDGARFCEKCGTKFED